MAHLFDERKERVSVYKSLVTNQEALDLDPPAQIRAADEDELAADFERFLQTGEA